MMLPAVSRRGTVFWMEILFVAVFRLLIKSSVFDTTLPPHALATLAKPSFVTFQNRYGSFSSPVRQ